MILFNGNILPDEQFPAVIDGLWDCCVDAVINRKSVDETAHMVMDACDILAKRIQDGAYDAVLQPLLEKGVFEKEQLDEAISLFQKENMAVKYDTELGVLLKGLGASRSLEPLGILFHIAAGNAEGLPFFSVIEGLLAGNVNILKLPSADDGISILLLHELVKACPYLAPYICVVDVASTDLAVMKRLADFSDGVVVWGGDAAVKAVRTMVDTKTKIISWGHKLSFSYATLDVTDEELTKLAEHICKTRQVLCNSCQGIFVDTSDEQIVADMGKRFLNILQKVSDGYPKEASGIRGKVSLSLYNEELESADTGRKVLRGDGVSVVVSMDSELQLSYMFRNCWVKPLPRERIVHALKGNKGHLQTVGLMCADRERMILTEQFVKAGLTHVARADGMSHAPLGMSHDGEYPLRCYTRVVEVE